MASKPNKTQDTASICALPLLQPEPNLSYQRAANSWSNMDNEDDWRGYKPPPVVLCGLYGATMLGRSPACKHAFNLLIFGMWRRIDETDPTETRSGRIVYAWYYDREGAMQSDGIDILHDVPRFLVLLFAMQRFERSDWGFIPELDPEADSTQTGTRASFVKYIDRENPASKADAAVTYFEITFPSPSGVEREDFKVKVTKESLRPHFSLIGRGTQVYGAESCGEFHEIAVPGQEQLGADGIVDVTGQPLVLKIAWVDSSRTSEPDIVKLIFERAIEQGHREILQNLPRIYASIVFDGDGYTTTTMRKRMKVKDAAEHKIGRMLVIFVAERLKQVDQLGHWTEYPKAFLGLLKCACHCATYLYLSDA